MNTITKSIKLIAFAVLAIGFSSCSKSKTEGVISVINLVDNSPVAFATAAFDLDVQVLEMEWFPCGLDL